jgi:hypothetical protein
MEAMYLVEGKNLPVEILQYGLSVAAQCGNIPVARYLLDQGAFTWMTPPAAAKGKSVAMFDLLVEYGWIPTESTFEGNSILMCVS